MRILIIEDDIQLCQTLAYRLKKEGIHADHCHDGAEGLMAARENAHDLILLDRMLPSLSGTEVLSLLRKEGNSTPVILVTALGEVKERVQGLDCGADDYLVKPFAFEELLARLRVLLRKPATQKSSVLRVADLSLHMNTRRVFRGDKEIRLSSKEYALLHYMMQNAGVVLSRDKLEQHVWDYDFSGGSNVIDVYIRYLRKKVDEGYENKLIHTVRGHGYILREDAK